MDNWVSIMTFTNLTETTIPKLLLDSEGIECFILNELTTQINPMYSNAVGGAILQVKDCDISKATSILTKAGYLKEEHHDSAKSLTTYKHLLSRIPIIRKLQFEIQLTICIVFIVIVFSVAIFYITMPSKYERLTQNSWCLTSVKYENNVFVPSTIEPLKLILLDNSNDCSESIKFDKNGTVSLPGFNSRSVFGGWKLENGKLEIMNTDSFSFVYKGIYDVYFSSNGLILKSSKTTLYCGD